MQGRVEGVKVDWLGLALQILGAVSGIGAAVAAFQSRETAKELNRIEMERDAKQAHAVKRYQAEHLAVVGVECVESGSSKKYGLLIVNGSEVPVYNVCVKCKTANGARENPELNLVIIPPGQFIILMEGSRWGALLVKETARMEISVIAKGQGGKMVTSVAFSDASSRRWMRRGDVLSEVEEHAVAM